MSGTDTGGCGGGCGGACGCDGTSGTGGSGAPATLPGDPARYRYGAILERLLDHVGRAQALGGRPLAGLGRSLDDPAVALLAATAAAHHVLARTLHRLAVDSTLPGTEDRTALVRLAGMLGHRPRPAIAARALLDVRVAALPGAAAQASPSSGPSPGGQPGAPQTLLVPAGLTVASVAQQDQPSVTFETDADLQAHAAWNEIEPLRPPVLPVISQSTTRLEVEGIALGARVGDQVLVRAGGVAGANSSWLLARVTAADLDASATPPYMVLTVAGGRLLTVDDALVSPSGPGTVLLLGARAQAFGATAPDITFMPESVREARGGSKTATEWTGFVMGTVRTVDGTEVWDVHLDGVHPETAPGQVVVLESPVTAATAPATAPAPPPKFGVARIAEARETARSDYALSLRTTLIRLGKEQSDTFNKLVRQTTLHVQTARGRLLARPADPVLPITGRGEFNTPLPGQHPDLPAENLPDRLYLAGEVALPPGRRVVLTGLTRDGEAVTEPATVARSEIRSHDGDPPVTGTLLVLDAPLTGRFKASTLRVLGNVVYASAALSSPSGPETLGSGDPARALPRYALTRSPLARVAAPGPLGYAPAIEVRVAGRRYEPVASLYGQGPDSRRFAVVDRPDGGAEVQFAGRLRSGTGNVVASYRSGGGAAGNVPAGRLTQVLTPIVGLGPVTNPQAADGGSDAETLAGLRESVPTAIRALDRAVALADFEAFAQAYRDVGRAGAVELRTGVRRIVCITVSTGAFEPPGTGSTLPADLHDALSKAAPPGTHVVVAGFVDLPMRLSLALATDPELLRGEVEQAVRAALVRDLGRRVRPFGTAVHRSQVLAGAQAVPGVLGAVLTGFTAGDPADPVTEDAAGRLPCPGPTLVTESAGGTTWRLEPARLLSVSAGDVTFTELTA